LRYFHRAQQRQLEKHAKRRGFIQIDNTIEHGGGNRDEWKAAKALGTISYFTPELGINSFNAVEEPSMLTPEEEQFMWDSITQHEFHNAKGVGNNS